MLQHATGDSRTVRTAQITRDNIAMQLQALHPVIRANPVTGYKNLFVKKE